MCPHENLRQEDGLLKSHGAAQTKTQVAQKTEYVLACTDSRVNNFRNDGYEIQI